MISLKNITHRKFFILLLIVCFYANISQAQKIMRGRIVDFFTNQAIPDSLVQLLLLNQDSVFIDSCYVDKNMDQHTNRVATNYFCSIPKEGNYILKCSHPDYKTEMIPLQIKFYKREEYIQGKDIRLKREIKSSTDLPEFNITATKLKFFFRGDTVVYNADVFNTQYGLVLDDLLKKMPGITIENGYEIYSNGRKVDELLLNGKNFFNSDRETLLENLPAYMIKHVKVYEHNDSIELRKRLNKKPPLALDVRLKVGYNSSLLGNVDIGAGSDNRYFGRALGMRIHDLYRWTAFAGSNNINRNEEADKNGQLYNMDNGTGDKKFHVAGFNYNAESPTNIYLLSGKFRIQGSKESAKLYKVEKQFYEDGDIYAFSDDNNSNHNFSVQTSHTIDLFRFKPYNLRISPSVSFVHSKGLASKSYANANSNLANDYGTDLVDSIKAKSLGQKLLLNGISRILSEQSSPKKNLQFALTINQDYHIPHTEDLFSLEITGAYIAQDSKLYNKFELTHLGKDTERNEDIWKNIYQNYNNKNWKWGISPSYMLKLNHNSSITFNTQYLHSKSNVKSYFYDLASIEGWGNGTKYEYALGILPSQTRLMDVLNTSNSHDYKENDDFWTFRVAYSLSVIGKTLSISLPMKLQKKNLMFFQKNNNQSIQRKLCSPDFELDFSKWMTGNTGYTYSIGFNVTNSMPDAFNFVSQRNNIYEVVVTQGNSNLKNPRCYILKGDIGFTPKRMQNHSLFLSYQYNRNQVATAVLLDKNTGMYTYTPTNVDGNQAFTANLSNSIYLNQKYRHKLKNGLSFYHIKSADYSGASLSETSTKTVIHNVVISEALEYGFTSQNTKYRGTITPFIDYQQSASKRENFQTIKAFDYGLSVSIHAEFPWSCRFNTEFKGTCRRGYNDKSMNDEEFIWNMGLVKSFKNNMSLTLNVVDLLGQRKNYYRIVTAQATVESIHDMLRRYIMLHFVWQFSKKK